MQTLPFHTLHDHPVLPHLPLRRRSAASRRQNPPLLLPLRRLRSLPPLYDVAPALAGKRFPNSIVRDEDGDVEEDDEDDDEDVAADEYTITEVDSDGEDEVGGEEVEEEEDEEEEEPREAAVRFEGDKRQRVMRLLKDVAEFGEEIIDFQELAGIYDFPLDRFQRLAIEAFLRGSSVVVSTPTSSGKTLIAEAAAVATVSRRRRLFYTTPLKALSNQKFREFRDTFGEGFVGLLTGDSAVNRDAPILIMTTEILRNMLYQSVGMASSESRLFEVNVIVLDEVHYLSDISRGTVWEETVIYCPKEVQLLCLSATIANPDELAGWINEIHGNTELVTNKKRPVPLNWHFSLKNTLLPLLDEKGAKINRKLLNEYLSAFTTENSRLRDSDVLSRKLSNGRRDRKYNSIADISRQTSLSKSELNTFRRSQVPGTEDTLKQLMTKNMLPAVWFIFSRKGCDAAVQYVETFNLLDECEISEVQLALKKFQIQYPDAVRESAVKGLLHGVAAHHAGCLPLWKSFVENLFQKGLLKVVFATETLAAGINMPARTAVISSLSKRSVAGRINLSSNELQQMAGRAGRRGIDKEGHAVMVQTPYEGADECCELLLTGLQPLVSQFTASYGMVLNLLAGQRVTHAIKESGHVKSSNSGRSLNEARKLIERSFGNYIGSNVMIAAKDELQKIQAEIELLSSEIHPDAVERKWQKSLTEMEYKEISSLSEKIRTEKRYRNVLRQNMELERMKDRKHVLEDSENGQLPFICLHYNDREGVEHVIAAVYIKKLKSLSIPHIVNMVELAGASASDKNCDFEESEDSLGVEPSYYVALGSDNSWYLFTEKWVKTVYKRGLPDVPLSDGDTLPHQKLRDILMSTTSQWEKLADSEFGGLWSLEGSFETWSWSLNVPVVDSLSEDDVVTQRSQTYLDVVMQYREQKRKVSRLKKNLTHTKGFKDYRKVINMVNFTKEKIERLYSRSMRLTKRVEQIDPSGWKEFLQISNVIHEARALDVNTQVIFPLGETAAAIRGVNELWLAMVLRNRLLVDLKPAQLAAVCGSLVSEGIKIRPGKTNCYIYEASMTVTNTVELLEDQRDYLLKLQELHRVEIPCYLDIQFAGMIEAWASGLTWKELMMDCAMDEGDLVRLLRRTIDLLAQIPRLPDIDPVLQKNAMLASNVMDRSPISELQE